MNTTTESTDFGLIAWLENTRVRLPLKGIECRFDITSGTAAVEIDQIFFQENAKPLDCTYTFPLPAGAAVHRCEIHINDRIVRAKVEEKREARRTFDKQKARGRRAALVESERENLFTLKLGNIQPGDLIVVRFAYVQTVERGAGEQRRLRVPVCPGVRYIPGKPLLRSLRGKGTADDTDQVPDASRISPPRMDDLHPDAAYFAITGTLPETDAAHGSLASPTHPMRAEVVDGRWSVALNEHGTVPDRDFVLMWEPPVEKTVTPRAWARRHGGYTYAMVQLRAPQDVAIAADFEQDFYFLVDRSGSMEGAKWEKTCEALTAFVGLLGKKDRVWITLFESEYQDFAEAPLPAHEVRDDDAFRSLVKQGTAGGTELVGAARHVLGKVRVHSSERRSVVIVITDGQVGNEDEVFETFAEAPAVTAFTFGIDTAVNDAFLRRLAAQHGGACVLQTPDDDIPAAVAGLADRLRRPVVTELRIAGSWEPGTTRLPDLFRGETADICLRTKKEQRTITLTGRRADGQTETWKLPLAEAASEAPRLLWVRERIASHESACECAKALKLAKQHNVLCKGAAFVAWDEAERVEIADETIYQPSMEQKVMACRSPWSARSPGTIERIHLAEDIVAGSSEDSTEEPSPEIHLSSNITLPGDITRRLQNWLAEDRTIRQGRRRVYEQLMEELRKSAECAAKVLESLSSAMRKATELAKRIHQMLSAASEPQAARGLERMLHSACDESQILRNALETALEVHRQFAKLKHVLAGFSRRHFAEPEREAFEAAIEQWMFQTPLA